MLQRSKTASFANAAGNIKGRKGRIKATEELLKKANPALKQALKDKKIEINNPTIRSELIKKSNYY
jgi:hypothetical protein